MSGAKALSVAKKYKVFSDAPWCATNPQLYKQLALTFHDAKFILTIRDTEKWWKSVSSWVNCAKKDTKKSQGIYTKLIGAQSFSEVPFKSGFDSYNTGVINFFRNEIKQPQRLLVVDVTDPNAELGVDTYDIFCSFFGLESNCPNGQLPHSNPTSKKVHGKGKHGNSTCS